MTNNIQKYRKQFGYSQDELAGKLLVSRQTVSQWETGQTMPTTDNLLRLKEIFGVSVDALLGIDEDSETPPQSDPREKYVFCFSEPEVRSVLKKMKIDALLPLMLLSLFTAALAGLGIALKWNTLSSGCGILCIFFLLLLLGQRKALGKTHKKALARMVSLRYEYCVFEDYFTVVIYNALNVAEKSFRFSFSQIQNSFTVDDLLLLNVDAQLYMLRKNELLPDSAFLPYFHKKADINSRRGICLVSRILVALSVLSLFFAAMTATRLGGGGAVFSRLWVFFVFLIFPLSSILFGIISGKKGFLKNKKNIIVGIIFAFLLIGYGSMGLLFSHSQIADTTTLCEVENYAQTDFPEPSVSQTFPADASQESGNTDSRYSIEPINSSTVIFNDTDKEEIVKTLRESDAWMHPPEQRFVEISPAAVLKKDAYVFVYDLEHHTVNAFPEKSGKYHLLYAAYSPQYGWLDIDEYFLYYQL